MDFLVENTISLPQTCLSYRRLTELEKLSLEKGKNPFRSEMDNLNKLLANSFFNELKFVFDELVKFHNSTFEDYLGRKLGGDIVMPTNYPFFFSSDDLVESNVSDEMHLGNFQIKISFSANYHYSEMGLLLLSGLRKKYSVQDIRNYIKELRSCYIGNIRNSSDRVNYAPLELGEDYFYRQVDIADMAPATSIHQVREWNHLDILLGKFFRHQIIAFNLSHEFSHLILQTFKQVDQLSFQAQIKHAQNFAFGELGKKSPDWIDEFYCDAYGCRTLVNYFHDNHDPNLVREVFSLFNIPMSNIPLNNSWKLAYLSSRIFLLTHLLYFGESTESKTHPSYGARLDYVRKVFLEVFEIPEAILNEIDDAFFRSSILDLLIR